MQFRPDLPGMAGDQEFMGTHCWASAPRGGRKEEADNTSFKEKITTDTTLTEHLETQTLIPKVNTLFL